MLNVKPSSYWLEIMSMPSQTSVRGVACFAVKQVFAFAPEISWGIKNMYTPVHVGHVQQHFQPSRHLHLKLELQTKKIREKKQKLSLFQLTKKTTFTFSHHKKLPLWIFHLPKNFHFHFLTSPPVFPPFVGCPPPRPPLPPSLQRRRVLMTIINNFHYKTIDRSLTLRLGQRLYENLVECLIPRLTLPPIFLAAALLYNSCFRSPRSPAIYIVSRWNFFSGEISGVMALSNVLFEYPCECSRSILIHHSKIKILLWDLAT